MAKINVKKESSRTVSAGPLFGRNNYTLMIIGVVVLIVGFVLMAGGKSPDPRVFNENEVYSFTRITLAPILIVLGFGIEIAAIMIKPKTNDESGNDPGL